MNVKRLKTLVKLRIIKNNNAKTESKMNQGLAVHIITTLIYMGIVTYITSGEQTTIHMRSTIVVMGILINMVAAMICSYHNLYYKKTK